MLLMIDLKLQLGDVADPVSAILLPVTITINETPEVEPKSVVVVSVKLTLLPLLSAIIDPARALLPLRKVYSNQAQSYEAVGILYITLFPVFNVAAFVVSSEGA